MPHGLGESKASRLTILADFLLFTKLAVARGVIPSSSSDTPWEWGVYLDVAGQMIYKAFAPDKCGGAEKYGKQAGDGTALRSWGQAIYEGVYREETEADQLHDAMKQKVDAACWGEDGGPHFSFARDPSIYDDVGSVYAWKGLNEILNERLQGSGALKRSGSSGRIRRGKSETGQAVNPVDM